MNKEIYDEVLDQLNKLTAQVKDLIENDTDAAEIFEEDDCVEKVVDNKETVSLYANGGYSSHVFLPHKTLE